MTQHWKNKQTWNYSPIILSGTPGGHMWFAAVQGMPTALQLNYRPKCLAAALPVLCHNEPAKFNIWNIVAKDFLP